MTEQHPEPNVEETLYEPAATESATAPDTPEAPEARIAALEAKVAELQDAYLRAKAEGENLRRRAAEDVTKAHKFAVEKFARELIAVSDSLDAALTDQAVQSLRFTHGHLWLTLKSHYVEDFEILRVAKQLAVAPSTFAASCSSFGRDCRPASSRMIMNGVHTQASSAAMQMRAGVLDTVLPALTPDEQDALHRSAEVLLKARRAIGD